METELSLYFQYVTELNPEVIVEVTFPFHSVSEKTVCRVAHKCQHQEEKLSMVSLHKHEQKKIQEVTGLKLKDSFVFVHPQYATQKPFVELVSMFE